MSIVSLLTDFGHRDPYVGLMKGMILERCPAARLIDLSHEIPAQDISVASFWLSRVLPYFPPQTVHLAVVDPGVGTDRKAIAVRMHDQFLVLPDNGLLSDLMLEADTKQGTSLEVVELAPEVWRPPPRAVGTTFHGRDLFAPAAGILAKGQSLDLLGPSLDPTTLCCLGLLPDSDAARVRVIDHYGNLITDAPSKRKDDSVVYFDDEPLPWADTYGAVGKGELVVLSGSWGTIEVAVNQGSARQRTGARVGTRFRMKLRETQ